MQGRQPGETSQSSFRTGSSSCQGCSATVATPRGLSRGAEGVRWQKISSICDTVVSFSLLSALVIASLAVGRNGPKSQGCLSRTSSCCRERCYLAFAHFFMVRCVPGAFAPFSATWSAFSEVVACHGSDDVLRSRRSSEVHRRGAPGGTDASLHIALLHLTWLCCMYPSANVDLHKMGCPKRTVADASAEAHFLLVKSQLAEFKGAKSHPEAGRPGKGRKTAVLQSGSKPERVLLSSLLSPLLLSGKAAG